MQEPYKTKREFLEDLERITIKYLTKKEVMEKYAEYAQNRDLLSFIELNNASGIMPPEKLVQSFVGLTLRAPSPCDDDMDRPVYFLLWHLPLISDKEELQKKLLSVLPKYWSCYYKKEVMPKVDRDKYFPAPFKWGGSTDDGRDLSYLTFGEIERDQSKFLVILYKKVDEENEEITYITNFKEFSGSKGYKKLGDYMGEQPRKDVAALMQELRSKDPELESKLKR